MQCRVLGPVDVVAEGRPVPLTTTQRTILASLLLAPGATASADRLIDAVWRSAPPAGARKALHNHVARLRRTLAGVPGGDPQLVATEGQGYRLALRGHEVDAHRFEALLVQARAADDADRVVALLGDALGLWRGPAFGELAAHELLQSEAIRLEELRAEAVADRVDALLRLGRHTEVIGDLEREVSANPLRERPHAQLMLALYRAGRTAEALATFRQLEQRLGQELGVDPAPELQRLHERILRQEPALQAPRRVPLSGTQRTRSATRRGWDTAALSDREPRGEPVAGRRGRLLGRENDIAAVAELVAACALVTLTGAGGVGKTRLAEAVAGHVARRFSDGVVVVELVPLREAAALDHAVAGALGVMPGEGDLRDRVVSVLQGRQLLLVVDNCEHPLPEMAELVEQLLRRCRALTVLATSRERLAVDGEHLYPVSPLQVPAAGEDPDPGAIARSPAVQLFCERAVAVDPGFALTAANSAAVVDVCRRLDGVPLALELAAARVSAMTVADLAARLHERFGLLTGGPRREGGRHRALAGVGAWSYGLLESQEALLFDRLSVFAGGFTLDAAERVCGGHGLPPAGVIRALASLADKSMVLRTKQRYRILETLRAYGHTRLAERGETHRTHSAHARFFADLVEQAGAGARGPDGAGWLQRVRQELDNLRAAHRWAINAGAADLALRLCAPLAEDGAWWLGDEVATWAEEAAALPDARGHPLQPVAYGAAATGAAHRGEFDYCMRLAQLGLQAAPDAHDPRRLAPLRALSLAAIFQGRLADSERIEAEILGHAHAIGDIYRAVFVHIARAMHAIYRTDPDPEAARTHAQQACAQADTLGNPQAQAFAYYIYGEALVDRDPDQALQWLERSLKLARSIPVRLTEAMALLALSTSLASRGEPKAALDTLGESIRLWRRAGDWAHQWTTLRNLAFLLARLGEDQAAAVLIGAIDTTRTAAPAYGTDAERMRTTRTHLRIRLGDDRYEHSRRAGARMSDDQAVTYALDRIQAAHTRRTTPRVDH